MKNFHKNTNKQIIRKNTLRKKAFIGVIFFILLLSLPIESNHNLSLATAENDDEIVISMRRLVGTAVGNKISGKFRITVNSGISTNELVYIELLFNDTTVSEGNASTLSFTFNTKEYGIGLMNITAIGKDFDGNNYQTTLEKHFMNPKIANVIGISIAVFALIISGISVWKKYFKDRKKHTKDHQEKLDEINIESKF
jgi:hypothetical protein